MSLAIAVDFDGTIVEHRFPQIGKPLPGAFEVLKELQEAGHKLMLWTCRENDGYKIDRQFLTEAVNFCEQNGLKFDAINETPPGFEFRCETTLRRKPHCKYYIDDAIVGGFPGWEAVRQFFSEINKKKENSNDD